MSGERVEVDADTYFAVLPEWVLYAPISSNAVRLYAVLRRHADKNGSCHPTRGRLATLVGVSKATVDRAVDELVAIHALKVTNRRSEKGDWTSNVYHVRSIPPRGVSSRVDRPLLTGDETGLLTGDEQTIASSNQSQEPGRVVAKATHAGEVVAKAWWEAQTVKPVGARAWHALKAVCKAAVDRGYSPEQITAALNRIGTVPSVAQLDRELKRPNAGRETNRERQIRDAAERLAAMRAEEDELKVAALFAGELES